MTELPALPVPPYHYPPYNELPHEPACAYFRAVLAALGPEAGSTDSDDSLCGWLDDRDVPLYELFIGFGPWTLVWDQANGWTFALEGLDGEDEPGERRRLIEGAIVPAPHDVVRAAHMIPSHARGWTLPIQEQESPVPADIPLTPALQDLLREGFIRPDTANRLAAFVAAERVAFPH
ncbi:DUF6292 family protein [Kitasatospora sp. NPDC088160]|uniref:DUF6292 family protein n=1 Tax=Kitasatospora sp. NPDC088160 TaxID=3364072 RepID=UPI003808D26E